MRTELRGKHLRLDPNCEYGKFALEQFRKMCPNTSFRFMEMKGDGTVTFHLYGDDPDRFHVNIPYLILATKDAEIARLREALKKIDAEDDTGPLVFEADENGRMRASHNAKGRFAEIARAALEASR